MTSYIQNNLIKINMRETMNFQKSVKVNRWLGYNVRIIKDNNDALEELKKIMERKASQK
jgi:hypothetical protein